MLLFLWPIFVFGGIFRIWAKDGFQVLLPGQKAQERIFGGAANAWKGDKVERGECGCVQAARFSAVSGIFLACDDWNALRRAQCQLMKREKEGIGTAEVAAARE